MHIYGDVRRRLYNSQRLNHCNLVCDGGCRGGRCSERQLVGDDIRYCLQQCLRVVDNLGADIDASVSIRLDDGGNFRQGDRVRQSCGIRLGRSVSLSGCLSVDLE